MPDLYESAADITRDDESTRDETYCAIAGLLKFLGRLLVALILGTIAAMAFFYAAAARADAPAILVNPAAPYAWNFGAARTWVDRANAVRPYGSAVQHDNVGPWDESIPVASYVNGYPVGDFGGYLDPGAGGTYTVSYKGAGRLAWFNVAGSTATTVDFTEGKEAWFTVTGTSPADAFRDFHILRSGVEKDAQNSTLFTPEFLNDLRGCAAVRTMDWARINSATPAPFANRQKPDGTQTTMERGVALEYQVELANAMNCDLWLCLYDFWGDEDHKDAAAFVNARLRPGLHVYVEIGNEIWNGFPQQARMLVAAQRNPRLTSSNQWERLAQHHGDRLRSAVLTFRSVMGKDRVRGVLPGQGVNTFWVETPLAFLEAAYGPGTAADIVYAASYADYWYVNDNVPNPTVQSLGASLLTSVTADAAANLVKHRAAAGRFGVNRIVTYEGGEHVTDRVYDANGGSRIVNHAQHLALQRDNAMGVAYTVGIDQFFKGGGTMWGAYCSTAPWLTGEAGYFGWGERLDDDTPKRQAVRAYYATAIPPPVVTPVSQPTPTTAPTSQPSTRPATTQPINVGSLTVETQFGTVQWSPNDTVRVTATSK